MSAVTPAKAELISCNYLLINEFYPTKKNEINFSQCLTLIFF